MTDLRILYVTAKDKIQAREIARALLERKLIACANILPEMESLYRWEGEMQDEHEAVLLLKTESSLVSQVISAVEELHSYQTPCALEIEIASGSSGYLSWLRQEVARD